MITVSGVNMKLHHSVRHSLILAMVTREHLSFHVAADRLDVGNYWEIYIYYLWNYLQTSDRIIITLDD